MTIIIVFLFVIAVGLGFAFFILMKELKGTQQSTTTVLHTKGPVFRPAENAFNPHVPATSHSIVPPVKNGQQQTEEAFIEKSDQKCLKLEQLLGEKNHLLAQLQEEIQNERSHRAEFENFKDILQRQIEDLKIQNKKLKEDLARSLETQAQLGKVTTPFEKRVDPSTPASYGYRG